MFRDDGAREWGNNGRFVYKDNTYYIDNGIVKVEWLTYKHNGKDMVLYFWPNTGIMDTRPCGKYTMCTIYSVMMAAANGATTISIPTTTLRISLEMVQFSLVGRHINITTKIWFLTFGQTHSKWHRAW